MNGQAAQYIRHEVGLDLAESHAALRLAALKFAQLARECPHCDGLGVVTLVVWDAHPIIERAGRPPCATRTPAGVGFSRRACARCLEIRQLELICLGVKL